MAAAGSRGRRRGGWGGVAEHGRDALGGVSACGVEESRAVTEERNGSAHGRGTGKARGFGEFPSPQVPRGRLYCIPKLLVTSGMVPHATSKILLVA